MLIGLVWLSRSIPVVAAIAAIAFLIYIIANPDNWETNYNDSDTVKLLREKNRGTLVSVVIAVLLNFVGAFMFYIKVKEGLVVTNYGFILGPVVGFLLDQGIGTDEGFAICFTTDGLQFTFASLVSADFVRYIVTVFLDLFISNPLQDVMKSQLRKLGVIEMLKMDVEVTNKKEKSWWVRKYDWFVALNFPSILQSVVAFITFNAYTNQTRFAWAYAAETLDRDRRIPPGTIMVGTSIAGVMYLIFYATMDHFSDRAYYGVNTKICYCLIILLLLTCLNYSESLEAPVEGESYVSYTGMLGEYKPILGFALFVGFLLYGFVYPVWTRLGCICGKCRPSMSELADTDHIMEQQEGTVLPDDQKKAIRLEVQAALEQMGIVGYLRDNGFDIVPVDPIQPLAEYDQPMD